VAAALIGIQTTEFAIKVAILSSLLVTCALVPAFEWMARRMEARKNPLIPQPASVDDPRPFARRALTALRNPVTAVVVVIALAAPINTALLARDKKIQLIERGLTTRTVQ
jgi:hypothetical protein